MHRLRDHGAMCSTGHKNPLSSRLLNRRVNHRATDQIEEFLSAELNTSPLTPILTPDEAQFADFTPLRALVNPVGSTQSKASLVLDR